MADSAPDFAKMVPGFDFLQGLVKNAGSVLPQIGQWVAPTLDPAEIDKRIEELRTVQFWLEQNARMLAATIQALEVQRMTLSTLKTMNVQVADLQESMRMRMSEAAAPAPSPAAAPAPAPAPSEEPPAARRAAPRKPKGDKAAPAPEAPVAGIVDPTQWWNAITQQFTQLAANALKDSAPEALQKQAGAMVNQGFEAAGRAFGAGAPQPSAKPSAKPSTKPAAPKAHAATRPARKAAAPRPATKRAR